ncbi:MAG: SDR family NAD(P)-dependent oxidoreductase [Hyphomicrobiaceae bacterium]
MPNPFVFVADLWLRRYRRPEPRAEAEAGRGLAAVVITGASEGIGLALAHRFAASGATVVMIARHADRLEAAARKVREQHGGGPGKGNAIALALDVTREDAAQRIDQALAERGLFADVVVNNAGIGLSGAFVTHDVAAMHRLIDLNITALSVLTRHYLPGMLARGRGGIINIASLAGFAPGPYQAIYYASKAFVISLTRAVAHEVRGQGVRVCVVVPGPVDTRFHERMGAQQSIYRQFMPGASAESVARSAYRGFRLGLGVVYPGIVTPVVALMMRLLPGAILFPVIAWLLRPGSDTDAGR